MESAKPYEEIIDFIASGTTPESVIAFRPSGALQSRVTHLAGKAKAGDISPEDLSEFEDCLQLEHIMVLAKARARQLTKSGE